MIRETDCDKSVFGEAVVHEISAAATIRRKKTSGIYFPYRESALSFSAAEMEMELSRVSE